MNNKLEYDSIKDNEFTQTSFKILPKEPDETARETVYKKRSEITIESQDIDDILIVDDNFKPDDHHTHEIPYDDNIFEYMVKIKKRSAIQETKHLAMKTSFWIRTNKIKVA